MPHEQPHLDYQAECLLELEKRWQEAEKVIDIQNQAIRAALNCPNPVRTPRDCQRCRRAECVAAWVAQDGIWDDVKK